MNRKYEFVDGDTITIEGRTLHRIRAIEDIGRVARKGDLGGYIESKENLSEDAWVAVDAKVFDNAKVYGDALVSGDALVLGNAKVFGNASVTGNAKVSGDANVDENNVFVASNVGSESGNLTVFTGASGDLLVTRGCFYGTDGEFLAQVREKHAGTRYQTEYELLIKVARSRILGD